MVFRVSFATSEREMAYQLTKEKNSKKKEGKKEKTDFFFKDTFALNQSFSWLKLCKGLNADFIVVRSSYLRGKPFRIGWKKLKYKEWCVLCLFVFLFFSFGQVYVDLWNGLIIFDEILFDILLYKLYIRITVYINFLQTICIFAVCISMYTSNLLFICICGEHVGKVKLKFYPTPSQIIKK